jgi:hypothetical protein
VAWPSNGIAQLWLGRQSTVAWLESSSGLVSGGLACNQLWLGWNQAAALLPVAWPGLAGYRPATANLWSVSSSGLTRLHQNPARWGMHGLKPIERSDLKWRRHFAFQQRLKFYYYTRLLPRDFLHRTDTLVLFCQSLTSRLLQSSTTLYGVSQSVTRERHFRQYNHPATLPGTAHLDGPYPHRILHLELHSDRGANNPAQMYRALRPSWSELCSTSLRRSLERGASRQSQRSCGAVGAGIAHSALRSHSLPFEHTGAPNAAADDKTLREIL